MMVGLNDFVNLPLFDYCCQLNTKIDERIGRGERRRAVISVEDQWAAPVCHSRRIVIWHGPLRQWEQFEHLVGVVYEVAETIF